MIFFSFLKRAAFRGRIRRQSFDDLFKKCIAQILNCGINPHMKGKGGQ